MLTEYKDKVHMALSVQASTKALKNDAETESSSP